MRGRVAEIGQAEFEEIKNVLIQDAHLPADADERTVYMEFAALFLEQHYFSRSLLEGTFPGLRDKEAMRLLLEQDVKGGPLFRHTRLKGAGDPVVQTFSPSQEAQEFYDKLVAESEQAMKAGNIVLSAIQKQRAARVAPPDLGKKTLESAHDDMYRLAERLKNALGLRRRRALPSGKPSSTRCSTRPTRANVRPRRRCSTICRKSASTTSRKFTLSIWSNGCSPSAGVRSKGRCRASVSCA